MLWLKKIIPDYTIIFTRLMIINAIIESLAYPLITSIQATGKIKWYQITTGSIILLILPISYLFFKLGFPPQTIMYVMIVITLMAHLSRIYFMRNMLKMNISDYLKQVICPISMVAILAFVLPLLFYYSISASFVRLGGVCAITLVSSAFLIFYIGLTKSERNALKMFLFAKIRK